MHGSCPFAVVGGLLVLSKGLLFASVADSCAGVPSDLNRAHSIPATLYQPEDNRCAAMLNHDWVYSTIYFFWVMHEL
ncbi:hypothetical protein IQ07DRAFT_27152 [Pyrenochaeta sp. DS3sAY3a]|nr:hypothetical protein IQ07DRAFT_27152 [Pyrenochaeta sp. DS3sAY3a]